MSNHKAVIDLGTNTFHLLIVAPDEQLGFREVFRERRFIKLAEGGIEYLGDAAVQRGLEALVDFKSELDRHQVVEVRAIGTAALRTARNGSAFIKLVKDTTGIQIELIDGSEEARLIHLGVALATPLGTERGLIMDIGGGSVEFIIADVEKVYWAQSFPVGVAVLYERFHKNEPISEAEQMALKAFLKEELQSLIFALERYPCRDLLGASGTFDVLEDILVEEKPFPLHSSFPTAAFSPVAQKMIQASLRERLEMAEMPSARAEMIVVALLLLEFVLSLQPFEQIFVSAYALKEGVLTEMLA
jgi:exopolyphosphatase/guanosine-5'-triphosphate,3'-diphosphate pyrophosphatase